MALRCAFYQHGADFALYCTYMYTLVALLFVLYSMVLHFVRAQDPTSSH